MDEPKKKRDRLKEIWERIGEKQMVIFRQMDAEQEALRIKKEEEKHEE